jgi:multiple antibiotic resistance protein
MPREPDRHVRVGAQMEIFFLVLAAVFPVVNPPGSALVFLSLTQRASVDTRRFLARRVALNSFFVMSGSLLLGTFVLSSYGISLPVIRVAGGIVVAVAGWKLLNEGSEKHPEGAPEPNNTDYRGMAFYPLTLPLTTGPGTIAVMISLGFGRSRLASAVEELRYVAMTLLAAVGTAATIYICFLYADRVERLIGRAGTDIAVRLSAFILFCIGVQILWTGASELLSTLPVHVTPVVTRPGG